VSDSRNYVYSKKITIYTEDFLSVDQVYELDRIFEKKGFDLELRGPAFREMAIDKMLAEHLPAPQHYVIRNYAVVPADGTRGSWEHLKH